MKKGFTMIELIFVIVILGILAAVAIPKLAATRDDAKTASIKSDLATIAQAIPAWYQGQKESSVINALSIDTTTWVKDAAGLSYTYKENAADTDHITIKIVDANSSANAQLVGAALANTNDPATVTFAFDPWLVVDINGTANDGIVQTLVDDLNVKSTQTGLAGNKVKW